MGKTNRDKDFRILRTAGKNIMCLFGSKPLRRSMGANGKSDLAVRLFTTYTKDELYHTANRRHSAAHRDSARKTRHRCERSKKRSASFEAKKEMENL